MSVRPLDPTPFTFFRLTNITQGKIALVFSVIFSVKADYKQVIANSNENINTAQRNVKLFTVGKYIKTVLPTFEVLTSPRSTVNQSSYSTALP